jgi:hypothetical protein
VQIKQIKEEARGRRHIYRRILHRSHIFNRRRLHKRKFRRKHSNNKYCIFYNYVQGHATNYGRYSPNGQRNTPTSLSSEEENPTPAGQALRGPMDTHQQGKHVPAPPYLDHNSKW